jgi:uncharacterized protein
LALLDNLRSEMEKALRGGDKLRLSTLRMVISAVNYYQIEKQKTIDDNDVIVVLNREAKKHRESIEAFEKGNRPDLVDKEKAELAIISTYLPEQMSRDEIIVLAKKVIAETGAAAPSDKGKVMGKLVPQTKGKADGKMVSDVVDEILSGK